MYKYICIQMYIYKYKCIHNVIIKYTKQQILKIDEAASVGRRCHLELS